MQADSLHSLKPGSIINNFEIVRILGAGGFGITYLAKDLNLNLDVVIKEYFPNEFAVRNSDTTITAKTSSSADYAKGKLRFKEEAQILATFDHPSIVKILGYFETNNTAYFVMKYEDGMDLGQYIKEKGKPFTQDEILTIIMPILEGLKEVHRHNYLHRDIKPGNILLRKNNSPVLIDFGATRIAVNDEQSKSVTSMLTEGYAPFEQYSTDLKRQGPFTDIYAIGAVMYKMITLQTPIASQTRAFQLMQDGFDPLQRLQSMSLIAYDNILLKAIDKSLENKPSERQGIVEELQRQIIVDKKDNKALVIDLESQNIITEYNLPIDIYQNILDDGYVFLTKNVVEMEGYWYDFRIKRYQNRVEIVQDRAVVKTYYMKDDVSRFKRICPSYDDDVLKDSKIESNQKTKLIDKEEDGAVSKFMRKYS